MHVSFSREDSLEGCVYSNHDRAPTFSKITPVEFALRTSSMTHVRKTNCTNVKARLSP